MAAGKGGVMIVTLQCPTCKERNYTTQKNKNSVNSSTSPKFHSAARSMINSFR